MNISDYIKEAKKVLNEDAGSEGMVYCVEAKSGLSATENEQLKISEVKSENGVHCANVEFVFPHDYGFALNAIKEALPNIEIIALKLVY